MYYRIKVEDGEFSEKDEHSKELVTIKYKFHKELFELLVDYDVSCIDISGSYIIIATAENELFVFNNYGTYGQINNFRLKKRFYFTKKLIYNERDHRIHILGNKSKYEIYYFSLNSNCEDTTDLKPIYDEENVFDMFVNKKSRQSLLIKKNGDFKLLNNEDNKSRLLIRLRNTDLINSKINLIWTKDDSYIIWCINFELFVYDLNYDDVIIKLNLSGVIKIDQGLKYCDINLYCMFENVYILVSNVIYLLEIKKDSEYEMVNCQYNNTDFLYNKAFLNNIENSVQYNLKLVYKLDDSYSIVDVSKISIDPFNLKYTCVIATLVNSKDQLSVFTFDFLFRIVKHDKIYCKKYNYYLKDDDINKGNSEKLFINKEYVNLLSYENKPKFLKIGKSQLLIHKNKNKSYLIVDYSSQQELLLSRIKSDELSSNIFGLLDAKVSKEFQIYLIIKYINTEKEKVSFDLLDYILTKYSIIENGTNEFDIYVDIFNYYGVLSEFIQYVKRSNYFLELYTSIKDVNWHVNFLKLVLKKDPSLFYYVIKSFPIKETLLNYNKEKEIFLNLINYMENKNCNLKRYIKCTCVYKNKNASKTPQVGNDGGDINGNEYYFYLSYIALLLRIKTGLDKLIKYCFHLMSDYPSTELIQSVALDYFISLSENELINIKEFIMNSVYCILNTDNKLIVERVLLNNIANECERYYKVLNASEYYSFIFMKHLRYYYNKHKKKYNNIEGNLNMKLLNQNGSNINFEELENFQKKNMLKTVELHLSNSSHLLLDYILENSGLINHELALKLMNDYITKHKNEYDNEYFCIVIEAKSIILYLMGKKIDAFNLLIENGNVYGCLSLILSFNACSDNIFVSMVRIVIEHNDNECIQDLLYWYYYFIDNPIGELLSHNKEYLKGLVFTKSDYYYNVINKLDSKKNTNSCCFWHSIPFNLDYIQKINFDAIANDFNIIIESRKNKAGDNVDSSGNVVSKRTVHEDYLKSQLNLSSIYWNYYDEIFNSQIYDYADNISKANIINVKNEKCSLCNLKLFYHENDKVCNKVIVHHCSHNYHHECLVKISHLNEKSRKFKVNIENSISKNYFRCIICRFNGVNG
ncbi:protein with RING finger domain at C-terminus [Cryptosporidium ryanae]|uniref:protein with RING finger domain at C-terminus n=1 Tax=Cryptosporidium ryanae TaxID=515981 RepID=UPI00351A75C2|nr:protein with RING finger domain at C-terminus [Cryptosporidium ryanae]